MPMTEALEVYGILAAEVLLPLAAFIIGVIWFSRWCGRRDARRQARYRYLVEVEDTMLRDEESGWMYQIANGSAPYGAMSPVRLYTNPEIYQRDRERLTVMGYRIVTATEWYNPDGSFRSSEVMYQADVDQLMNRSRSLAGVSR